MRHALEVIYVQLWIPHVKVLETYGLGRVWLGFEMQSPIVHEAIQTEDRTKAATVLPAMATHEMHKIKIDKHGLTADLDRTYPDLMLIVLGRMGAVQIVYCAAICCIYLHISAHNQGRRRQLRVERDLIIMHALCSAAAEKRSGIEAGLGRGPPQTSGLEPREKQFPSRRSFVLSRRRRCIKRRGEVPSLLGSLDPWMCVNCKLFGWCGEITMGAGSCSACVLRARGCMPALLLVPRKQSQRGVGDKLTTHEALRTSRDQ